MAVTGYLVIVTLAVRDNVGGYSEKVLTIPLKLDDIPFLTESQKVLAIINFIDEVIAPYVFNGNGAEKLTYAGIVSCYSARKIEKNWIDNCSSFSTGILPNIPPKNVQLVKFPRKRIGKYRNSQQKIKYLTTIEPMNTSEGLLKESGIFPVLDYVEGINGMTFWDSSKFESEIIEAVNSSYVVSKEDRL